MSIPDASSKVLAALNERAKTLTRALGKGAAAKKLAPLLAELAAFDQDDYEAEIVAKQLEKGIVKWKSPNTLALAAVLFEWSHSNLTADASGFASVSDGRGDPQFGDVIFEDRSGFDVATIMLAGLPSDVQEVCAPEGVDQKAALVLLDIKIVKVAHVAHRALQKATQAKPFKALLKADTVRFYVGQHDRAPVLAYVWSR